MERRGLGVGGNAGNSRVSVKVNTRSQYQTEKLAQSPRIYSKKD